MPDLSSSLELAIQMFAFGVSVLQADERSDFTVRSSYDAPE